MPFKNRIDVVKAVLSNPQMIKLRPSINWFFARYMMKFPAVTVGDHVVLHSHLPPLNSKAYTRFINEHLLARTEGPSHAQIGLTNACPQNCEYCYNKNRTGKTMDKETIKKVIRDLKEMGVVWLGFTGGEPLLNKDILEITESASEHCAVKLFTTGCTLTKKLASDLKAAGVFSVCVSLDHHLEEEHDRRRRYPGAFKQAMNALEIFKEIGGIHVGVSAVFSRNMIQTDRAEEFLRFLIGLGIHEAWLSEVKPSIEAFWDNNLVITEEDRLKLIQLQDRYNKAGKITVNYLGHFEGKEYFGCNAGCKMVYVDAFGEVSPCVFTPMSFGNVKDTPVKDIFAEMRALFQPSHEGCFINTNYRLLQKYAGGRAMLNKEHAIKMMEEVRFGPPSEFGRLYYRRKPSDEIL
ncbi:MAG: radical SAM protein [Coprothermobacterota bacterium]|nr:radical SAM protein [Coprothermobacterota bacterium]